MSAARGPKSRQPAARSPREVAAIVVKKVLHEGAWTGPALHAALDEHVMSARDRALCSELARGTLRWSVPLEASLRRAQDKPKAIDKRILPHLLVAAYQLQHLQERIPARAVVHEAVETIKRVRRPLAGFANALLRNLGSAAHEQLSAGASLDQIAAAFGVPMVLAETVAHQVKSDEVIAAIAALNARPPLGLFCSDPEALMATLAKEGHHAYQHPFVPGAVLVDGAGDPRLLPGHAEGTVSVMDPGSALVALVAHTSGRMLDCCAAPGSKSLVLASMPDTEVVAVEQDERRAARIQENKARTRLPVEVVVGDATSDGLLGEQLFDGVLVDAPCSALGTTRRRPDVKRADKSSAEATAQRRDTQTALLNAAAARVRRGGALSYAVCSPLRDEGPAIVASFLSSPAGQAFERVSLGALLPWLPADAVDEEGAVRLCTYLHQTDGFYVARLQRAD